MLRYIARRILLMIPTLILISFVTFIVVQLPPGDYLNAYVAQLTAEGGETVDRQQIEMLRERYGPQRSLHRPVLEVDLQHHL